MNLINDDCLRALKTLPDASVDFVCCDPPYGVLNRQNPNAMWDKELDMEEVWPELRRVCKDNAAIVLFGQGLFSAKLMLSAPEMFRYSLIWDKVNRPTGFLDANRRPLRIHEDILVFYSKQPTYNPQMTIGAKNHKRGGAGNSKWGGGGKWLLWKLLPN